MKTVYKISSAKKMRRLGAMSAAAICKNRGVSRRGALVLALAGELGAGKTQFVKGLAAGLGIVRSVNSPTFVICKSYKISAGGKNACPNFSDLFHVDCYRLGSASQARQIKIDKIIGNPRNIVAVEWPQVVESLVPRGALRLEFKVGAKNQRLVGIASQDKNLLKTWQDAIKQDVLQ